VRKIRVYVDTSVFGGTQDEEFAEPSRRFFERVDQGEYLVLLSATTYGELERAPEGVSRVLRRLSRQEFEEVPVDAEVRALADAYLEAGIVGRASADDALHVAAATVSGADVILSWNFRHIVNYDRIRKFNAVNLMRGYRTLDVRSPLEMGYGDEAKDV